MTFLWPLFPYWQKRSGPGAGSPLVWHSSMTLLFASGYLESNQEAHAEETHRIYLSLGEQWGLNVSTFWGFFASPRLFKFIEPKFQILMIGDIHKQYSLCAWAWFYETQNKCTVYASDLCSRETDHINVLLIKLFFKPFTTLQLQNVVTKIYVHQEIYKNWLLKVHQCWQFV